MNVFITGSNSGLGFGLAKYYLGKGNKVYGISRKINSEINSRGNFSFLLQDISDFKELEINLVSFIRGVTKLDLVILNAGIMNEIKDLKETSLEEIKKVMDVNVWANKIIIDTLFNEVKIINRIVAISSGASQSGSRGWNAYSLSKATLNMLIKLYSKEFEETHFSALAPGLIDSKMQDYIYNLPEKSEYPVVERLKKAKGTEKMPSPEKAAEIVASGIENAKKYQSGIFLDVRKL